MPAFDVTASPTQLTLAAGETATVVVTVTNRLDRPAMARANKIVSPESAAAWVTGPPDPQRTFSATPATQDFRYTVSIPPGTAGVSVTFQVVVVEVDKTDDNFGEGNPVSVTVPDVIEPEDTDGISKWVWVALALVVVAAGIGAYAILARDGGMPNVVEMHFDDAERELQRRNIVVQRVDSLSAVGDTARFPAGAVIAQTPAPEAELTGTKEAPDTARLVVQKPFTIVPGGLVSVQPVDAASRLGIAGLGIRIRTQGTDSVTAQRGLTLSTLPGSGALAVRGDSVTVFVGSFCSRSIPSCNLHVVTGLFLNKVQEVNEAARRTRSPLRP